MNVFTHKTHARMEHEKYYTPSWATMSLIPHIGDLSQSVVWEPAAGAGDMARVLAGHCRQLLASDLAPEHVMVRRFDFLTSPVWQEPPPAAPFDIITNPPFGHGGRLARAFIERALPLTEPHNGRVAMLLRDDFDSAPGRKHLFRDHPAFDMKVVLLKRIRWVNLEQKAAGPSGAHAWYIWNWSRPDRKAAAVLAYQEPS